MRVLGFVLIVIGLIGLIYGGVTWTQQEKVLDVGPLEVTRQERQTIPLPPLVGGICLAAGAILVVADKRRRA
jgi:hypothetical protein